MTPGGTVALSLLYQPGIGAVLADANTRGYSNYQAARGLVFTQARITVELGGTPWSTTAVRRPARTVRLATFGVPPPPPYAGEISTYRGQVTCLWSWWAHHRVDTTRSGRPGSPIARPGGLSGHGCDFGVYLVR